MNEQPVIFVECGADLDDEKYPFTRKHYMWPNQTELFRQYYHNTGVYQTIMHYVNPIWIQDQKGKWIINARDSLKYGDFYLDFDTVIENEEDYQRIREDVKTAIRYLTVILSIDISQIQLFFSGNKGIHLTVDARVIGLEPHVALNQIYREIAVDIEKFCKHKTIDTRVYDDKRMFRMVNSINKKSGMYKIPITFKEFQECSYEEIKQLAKQPRSIEPPKPIVSNKAKMAFQKIVEEWTNRVNRQKEFTGRIQKLKVLPPCIKRMHEKIFHETVDERNNSATALTSFYYQQGISREEALHRMIQWGQENCLPALQRREIETIVNSVYNNQYRYGCETFKRLSGVCQKDECPLFNKELNVVEQEA